MRINPNELRVNPTTPPEPYKPWRTREEAWAEFLQKLPDRRRLNPLLIAQARIAFEENEPPWCFEEHLPEEVQRPVREPLAQMREAYERLLPELGGLTIKAQHDRVLRDLGIKGKLDGYGYDLFRKRVASHRRQKSDVR